MHNSHLDFFRSKLTLSGGLCFIHHFSVCCTQEGRTSTSTPELVEKRLHNHVGAPILGTPEGGHTDLFRFLPICSDLFRFAFLVSEYPDLFRSAPSSSDLFQFLFRTNQGNPFCRPHLQVPDHLSGGTVQRRKRHKVIQSFWCHSPKTLRLLPPIRRHRGSDPHV